MKTCILLRGVSGAGKTTVAKTLFSSFHNCCADDYFMVNGRYEFDATKLGSAHSYCKSRFQYLLGSGENIIISNTNIKRSDRDFYANAAKAAGYTVFSLVVENIFANENIHGVPPEKVDAMREKLLNNLDL